MIGLVAVTAAGRVGADTVAVALRQQGDEVTTYETSAADALRQAFGECDAVVCFLAVGAAVRLVAPLLRDKARDPGLVCVDEGSRHAVAVLGGHGGGANALAERVASVLGAEPVITTATDAVSLPGLDTLGWPVEGDVAGVGRALLDGQDVHLAADAAWPLPALGLRVDQVGDQPASTHVVHVTDREVLPAPGHVVLRPPSLVLGVGASRGAPTDQVRTLVLDTLRDNGLSPASVCEVVSIDLKADEVAIIALATTLGVPYRTFTAHDLDAHAVPTPSEVVAAATGSRSVAEASVLQAGADLIVAKRKNTVATVAVGRRAPRGRLALVGIGPGARDLMVPRAVTELRRASVVVGLDQYVAQVRDLLRPGTRVLETGLGSEEERARTAVQLAQQGHAVAVVGSGDAGVYAMASPTLEALEQALAAGGPPVDVVGVPGVTAALAASAALGAALGNDHAYISLSDLHTPWPAIEQRLGAVADADLVACLYNPRSARRTSQLPEALRIIGARRPPSTPVGVVRNASRPDESVLVSTLADLDPDHVDMYSVVIVGCSQSRVVDGHLITPRGYRWMQ